MGIALAKEIDDSLLPVLKEDRIQSISFIGHSLGGVIIRAALPSLQKYKCFFKTYMSLSTPHLGVGASDSKLVETGLNFLTSWKKYTCLKQLGLKDNEDPRKSYLYHLSAQEGLNWFKDIIFVSSPQDTYSPYDSSRVQLSDRNSSNSKTQQAYSDMVDNLTKQISESHIRRVDVCLKFSKQSLDTFIG